MVDVSSKPVTARSARAQARVVVGVHGAEALRRASLAKGDAFVTAQLAGIMAAKETGRLIPLAHPLPIAHADVSFAWDGDDIVVEARATTAAQTGVEMEAMVAASIAALTLYDMLKSVDKGIIIASIRLLEKSGGKSGHWTAP